MKSQDEKKDCGQPKARILIADDAPDVASRVKRMLSELDHVEIIGPAANGIEALDLYKKHDPIGIILDLQMPHLNGLQVLEEIRRIDKSALVIILSNQGDIETRAHCLKAGADHFLHKASDFEEVAKIIAGIIKK